MAACILASAGVMAGQGQVAFAATDAVIESTAGVSSVMQDYVLVANSDFESVEEAETLAVANVDRYVNIREEATKDSDVVGRLYEDGIATVLGTDGDWTKVSSGEVTGYILSEYLSTDAEDVSEACQVVGTVNTTTLYVRAEASTDAKILELLPKEEEIYLEGEAVDGWYAVESEDGGGYVSAEFVDVETTYETAISTEELQAQRQAAKEAKEAAEKAAKSSSEKKSSKSSSSKKNKSSDDEDKSVAEDADGKDEAEGEEEGESSSSSQGQEVASYALQFVGNPYRYGGTSLTNGADCSGFVKSVYAHFGVSLPHSSSGMRSQGYSVSVSDMQAGDIICYSGHVAIYVGNNTVVHASTEATGIKTTSPANYRSIICVRRIF